VHSYALVDDERTVEELARAAEVSGTVASQQLRVLGQLGAVAVRREGRNAFYRLRDHHMVELLTAVRNHSEHDADPPSRSACRSPTRSSAWP
jgi:DNA-binding transcriptional ArsR family regulator